MSAVTVSPLVGSATVAAVVAGGLAMARVVVVIGERRSTAAWVGDAIGDVRRSTARAHVARLGDVLRASRVHQWWSTRRAERERADLLPEFVVATTRALESGVGLRGALGDAAEVVGAPFSADMARMERRAATGMSLSECLELWAREVGGDDAALVATACVLGARTGRGTAEALAGVATTLSERRDVAAESRSLASQAKASATLLVVLPVVASLGLAFIDPTTVRTLVTTPLGIGCLVVGAALDVVGAWWMQRMIGAVA